MTSEATSSKGRVTLDKVDVWRGEGSERRRVLTQVSLDFEARTHVALVGPNGAGKTSLLLALVGAAPFEGEVSIGGLRLERRTLKDLRSRIGFVFAEPSDQLFMPTVFDEVAFGLRERELAETEVSTRALQALARVALETRTGERPSELSLGEQRRLAVAAVLACEPELLLLDEPTAGLDPVARHRMLQILKDVPATVVFATHDLKAALELRAHVVLFAGGKVVHAGPAEQVLTNPALLEAAGLLVPGELPQT